MSNKKQIVVFEDLKIVYVACGVNTDIIQAFQARGFEVRYVF